MTRRACATLAPLRSSGQLSPVDGDLAPTPGVRILATPGRTPGHQSVLLDGDDETLVFTSDLLVHVVQLIDPSVGYAHETDQRQARVARTRILAEATARGEVILATPHLGELSCRSLACRFDRQQARAWRER